MPAHNLSRMNDNPALSSTRPNDTSFSTDPTKPNFDTSKQFGGKEPSKRTQNNLTNPLDNSREKDILSTPTHKTDSQQMQPLSTVSSTSSINPNSQQSTRPNEISKLNSNKIKSDADPHKKGKQGNDFERNPNNDKSRKSHLLS